MRSLQDPAGVPAALGTGAAQVGGLARPEGWRAPKGSLSGSRERWCLTWGRGPRTPAGPSAVVPERLGGGGFCRVEGLRDRRVCVRGRGRRGMRGCGDAGTRYPGEDAHSAWTPGRGLCGRGRSVRCACVVGALSRRERGPGLSGCFDAGQHRV